MIAKVFNFDDLMPKGTWFHLNFNFVMLVDFAYLPRFLYSYLVTSYKLFIFTSIWGKLICFKKYRSQSIYRICCVARNSHKS